MDPLTTTLKAIADPTQRTILDLLREGGSSVSDLAGQFSVSRPAISKRLATLREAGLAVPRRRGRRQIYELDSGALRPLREWLEQFLDEPRSSSARRGAGRPGADRPSARLRPVVKRDPRDDWRCW